MEEFYAELQDDRLLCGSLLGRNKGGKYKFWCKNEEEIYTDDVCNEQVNCTPDMLAGLFGTLFPKRLANKDTDSLRNTHGRHKCQRIYRDNDVCRSQVEFTNPSNNEYKESECKNIDCELE